MATAASSTWSEQEAARKVLRRAEVSRIARVLQHRLALATFKTRYGLENLDLDTIEPRVEDDLRRKRGFAQMSDDHFLSHAFEEVELRWLQEKENGRYFDRKPSHGLVRRSSSRKRPETSSSDQHGPLRKRRTSWKDSHLPISSPGYREQRQLERDVASKLDEYSMKAGFNSSPPRTPPRRARRLPGSKHVSEDADLLLYLATSPSPAQIITKSRFTPSTPPSKSSMLPSSMMSSIAPPETPAQTFNFADFVNITPSPAQAAFPSRAARTPATIARRRLDFDQLVPPLENR